ncbi:hypothetical protein GIY23_12185 [Allosaccharopolyspora coralli]|uniref:Uncharacterized protein n=1 Tax=Allosaccharopolyspora coralli TaxID=2665642 RepID=A0A5Q3Q772_9PSEU|nr:hypothetical protein [Allosaccharopolyspora coralli]QGK70183.1 hypothetical protein GIY23_12185 [Allosaccharopolyspora coralli]
MTSQENNLKSGQHEPVKKRTADEARLRKFQDAIATGMDPAALVEAINEARCGHGRAGRNSRIA